MVSWIPVVIIWRGGGARLEVGIKESYLACFCAIVAYKNLSLQYVNSMIWRVSWDGEKGGVSVGFLPFDAKCIWVELCKAFTFGKVT